MLLIERRCAKRFRNRRFGAALNALRYRSANTVVEYFKGGGKAFRASSAHVPLPEHGDHASSARSIPTTTTLLRQMIPQADFGVKMVGADAIRRRLAGDDRICFAGDGCRNPW